jgi:hypothetical protein
MLPTYCTLANICSRLRARLLAAAVRSAPVVLVAGAIPDCPQLDPRNWLLSVLEGSVLAASRVLSNPT